MQPPPHQGQDVAHTEGVKPEVQAYTLEDLGAEAGFVVGQLRALLKVL